MNGWEIGTGKRDADAATVMQIDERRTTMKCCNVVAYAGAATRLRYRTMMVTPCCALCCIVSLYLYRSANETNGECIQKHRKFNGRFRCIHTVTRQHDVPLALYVILIDGCRVSLFYPVKGERRAYRLFTIQKHFCIGGRFTLHFPHAKWTVSLSKRMNGAEYTGETMAMAMAAAKLL